MRCGVVVGGDPVEHVSKSNSCPCENSHFERFLLRDPPFHLPVSSPWKSEKLLQCCASLVSTDS